MNKQRRNFINQISLIAGAATLSKPLASAASVSKRISTLHAAEHKVTIYSTNDLHGHIDAAYQHMGGLNHMKSLLADQETRGLLLDGGNFLHSKQSLHQQKQVINAMNAIGYHAAAVGNQELAKGQEHLAKLIPMMRFTLVNCNYTFNAALSQLVKPYCIIYSGPYKIGITGVGHERKDIGYHDAIESANRVAKMLKEEKGCHMVICLSHLGYRQEGDKPDNCKLARASEHIDMIVSGHNQKLMDGPTIVHNRVKSEVIISQAGYNGLMMGKTTFTFKDRKDKHQFEAQYMIPGQLAGQNFAASFKAISAAKTLA